MDWGRLLCSFSDWPGPLSSGCGFSLWSAFLLSWVQHLLRQALLSLQPHPLPWFLGPLAFLDGGGSSQVEFLSVGPDVVEALLCYEVFCMMAWAFLLATVGLPLLSPEVLHAPSQHCVPFFCTLIHMPVIGEGALMLFGLLWRRCMMSIRSLCLLLRHSAHVLLSPGVR